MRRIRYCVASSLDGFIAGPNEEFDWIEMDPSADFETFFKQFDSVLMGKGTYQFTQQGPGAVMPGMKTYVCSRTLKAKDHPEVTISSDAITTARELKSAEGKDIWLFGGGLLFRSLLDAKLVDTVELGVMPIALGSGVPLHAPGSRSPKLELAESKPLSEGSLSLTYNIRYQ